MLDKTKINLKSISGRQKDNANFKRFYRNNQGQSLIELIATVSFVSIALIAVLSLILISLVTQRRSSNYYTAVNLAREAIEAVRNIRDSNWLAIEYQQNEGSGNVQWNDNLQSPPPTTIYSAVLKFNPDAIISNPATPSRFSFDFIDAEEQLDQQSLICKKELGNTTIYLDCSSCIIDCQTTSFGRKVYLKPICDGNTDFHGSFLLSRGDVCPEDAASGETLHNFICNNGGSCDNDTVPQIGVRSTVEIFWTEGGQKHSLKVTEDIYNWR